MTIHQNSIIVSINYLLKKTHWYSHLSMSGVESLLKYRFTKKEADKLQKADTETGTDQKRGPGVQTKKTPERNSGAVSSIPDTPEGKKPSPGSPIFNNKMPAFGKRGVKILDSDSDEDSSVKTKSSPWLSKTQGIKQANGIGSSQETVTSSFSPGPSTSSSQQSSQSVPREYVESYRTICDMFPGHDRDYLSMAIKHTEGNVDKTVDIIISNKAIPSPLLSPVATNPKRKRIRQISATSSDSENPTSPIKKRVKQLQYQESIEIIDSDECTQENDDQNGNETPELKKQIDFLQEAFPKFSRKVLKMTLKAHNNSLDISLAALENFNAPENKTISTTENRGSIRAMTQARAHAVSNRPIVVSDLENEDDDDVQIIKHNTKKKTTPRNRSTRAGMVNGEKLNTQLDDDVEDEDYDSEDSEDEELRADSDPILEFFNQGTVEELSTMSYCSKKKAELLISIRPFDDWDDLTTKFQSNKLNFQLITSCRDILKIRNSVRKLMEHCEKISSQMENIISALIGKTSLEEKDKDQGYITKQPSNLNTRMKLTPYQMVGLNWLVLMHDQDLNGILADEMGLGKTIQAISFLAYLLEIGDKGPNIVIAPSSTLDNWLRELQTWCPSLKVCLYYGSQEDRREIRMQMLDKKSEEFHVILTTYNMATGSVEDRALLKKMKFHYAIFDEGHMLKNMASLRYQNLMKIRATRRILLTGTPLQNNLVELMSLLAFVMPEIFSGKTDQLKTMFTSITSGTKVNLEKRGDYEKECIIRAKRIMKPFFLRRLKTQVLQQLPKKIDLVHRVPLAFEQQDLYDDLRRQFCATVQSSPDKNSTLKSGATMMMQLRKAANHHLLHRKIFDDARLRQMSELMLREPTHCDAVADYIFEDMAVMSDFELHKLCKSYKSIKQFQLDEEQMTDSGKFRWLDEKLPDMKKNGDRVLLFSQFVIMLDVVEVYLKARGYSFIRLDGSTPVPERQELIDKFNTDTEIFVFLLSTRAGGLGINLTAANTVILHDIDFNPYNDKQAEDRCHRVGQTRDVKVHRLLAKNTIEDAMYRCAMGKLKLEEDVTGSGGKDEEESGDVASLLKDALAIENVDN